MTREGLQKGGNKSRVYALGFEPVNEEQFKVFHEVDALYNKKGGLESRSIEGHLTTEDNGQPNFEWRMMVNPSAMSQVMQAGIKAG
jgi:hypothetical protein